MTGDGPHTDKELLKRIQSGDMDAFRELFDLHWSSLCSVAAIYTHDMDIAEEIVANIFADLWTRRENLSISVKIRTYLHSAVRNRTQNYRRDQGRQSEILSQIGDDFVPGMGEGQYDAGADHKVEIRDSMERALGVVNQLPERYRLAFLYRWRDDWEYSDIADTFGVSINGAQALVSRAIRMIRDRIGARLQ